MNADLSTAITLYSRSKYSEAIDILLGLLEEDRQNWRAWFYLAMSYADSGRLEDGHRIMQVISMLCPDKVLKLKARISIAELEPALPQNPASVHDAAPLSA